MLGKNINLKVVKAAKKNIGGSIGRTVKIMRETIDPEEKIDKRLRTIVDVLQLETVVKCGFLRKTGTELTIKELREALAQAKQYCYPRELELFFADISAAVNRLTFLMGTHTVCKSQVHSKTYPRYSLSI